MPQSRQMERGLTGNCSCQQVPQQANAEVSTSQVRPQLLHLALTRQSDQTMRVQPGAGRQLGQPLEIIYRPDRRTLLAGPALPLPRARESAYRKPAWRPGPAGSLSA